MGWLFADKKKTISERKWREDIRPAFYAKGLEKREIDHIEALFWSDMNEEGVNEKGIDREEFDRKMEWLSESRNRENYRISERDIEIINEVLGTYL